MQLRLFKGQRKLRIFGGGESPYSYGWPSGGTSESGVVAQWLFDETASNPIVDEVQGISLTRRNSTSATYQYDGTSGLYTGLAPGINASGNFTRFGQNGADSRMDIGTGDFVIEFWADFNTSGTTSMLVLQAFDVTTGGSEKGYYVYSRRYDAGNDFIQLGLKSETSGAIVVTWSAAGMLTPTGTLPRKIRITGDRDGNAELFVDGISQGTNVISGAAGDLKAYDLHTFLLSNASFQFKGAMYELRVSKNTLTNNSGGPNGG